MSATSRMETNIGSSFDDSNFLAVCENVSHFVRLDKNYLINFFNQLHSSVIKKLRIDLSDDFIDHHSLDAAVYKLRTLKTSERIIEDLYSLIHLLNSSKELILNGSADSHLNSVYLKCKPSNQNNQHFFGSIWKTKEGYVRPD